METTLQTDIPIRSPGFAGFWLRFVAIFIDGMILSFAQFIVISPLLAVLGISAQFAMFHPEDLDDEQKIGMLAGIIGVSMVTYMVNGVIGWLYFALLESSRHQGTLGKIAVGIKVTDMEGGSVTFLQATGRHFGKIVSTMILCIGFIMAGFTEKKQALHDIMANCLVVKR